MIKADINNDGVDDLDESGLGDIEFMIIDVTSSNYFPGGYGDFAVATAPNPGWIFANYNLFVNADVDRTVLQPVYLDVCQRLLRL